ncbi:alpha-1,2-fucosyltransferase [Dysgonomonas sp. Marseille-P4677]|uniref:alpha-1,2-fucosyltransferase n=1 Tax=Dysgonomonas sp. Marseille-P4677 TaxID=2364790 RepID=UPI001912B2B2|nr:alpha-1,2-fucosyltransferase [Dysgonomonas sp. Marseille-P4677]MBK5722328.1 alpha-1,2-fucosyltransferase [Dysgonomonas sp. Marseille-P4677]
MIINYDSPGQLCNRIWSQLPSVAYGLEYEEKVKLINFDEYSRDFEDLNVNRLISFTTCKFLKRFFLSMKVRGYIQNGRPNIFSKLLGLNLIEGWSNRLGNPEMVEKHSDAIRDIYRFKYDSIAHIDTAIGKSRDYLLVGVHIRRGDYKTWLNGIYYYTDNVYIRIMKQIEDQVAEEGKKVLFLICSNEKMDLDNFRPLDCFAFTDSSAITDLYALSKCDYIIGPPSSYSQWASFYGQVPVRYIMSANDKLNLSEFSEVITFNRFKNGNVMNID